MPELFQRMGERFATNPARGFEGFVDELSALEGPALRGVSVPFEEERAAGRKARTEYLEKAKGQGYRIVESEERLAYLRALVDRFSARMEHRDRYSKIDVTLLGANIADGQAFPGGALVFTTALLDEPNEATVAGVVAHELAHLDRGHMVDIVRRGKLVETQFSEPGVGGITFDQMFTRQAAVFGMMFRPFRPEQEHEADCSAVTWLYLEGYDPRALAGFFERLHRRRNDAPDNPFPSFARTHPYSLDRRDHVQARLAQLQRWRPRNDLELFAENLKTLTPREVPAALK